MYTCRGYKWMPFTYNIIILLYTCYTSAYPPPSFFQLFAEKQSPHFFLFSSFHDDCSRACVPNKNPRMLPPAVLFGEKWYTISKTRVRGRTTETPGKIICLIVFLFTRKSQIRTASFVRRRILRSSTTFPHRAPSTAGVYTGTVTVNTQ